MLMGVLEMVLFHSAFVSLKARCPLTVDINPQDFQLAGERKLFQGYLYLSYSTALPSRHLFPYAKHL